MSEYRPAFVARKGNPGFGWVVDVLWPDKLYGTSHVLSKDEAKFLFEKGCDQVVIGSGQMGNVHLSPEAEAYFERKGCEVVLKPTPGAIQMFNRSRAKRIGLFHLTC